MQVTSTKVSMNICHILRLGPISQGELEVNNIFVVAVTQLVVRGRTSKVSIPRKETYILARCVP